MLSRVADALFWMSRYVERAEHIARLLDVWFHLELDLAGAGAAPYEMHWTALAAILHYQAPPAEAGAPATISQRLMFDQNNPSGILFCLAKARLNARSIRGTINSEVWRELNKLYWKLCDRDFMRRASESPYEFYQAVECGSALFQGLCDATSCRDEEWQFIQLGKLVERADKTLRILDIQYHLLHDLTNPADVSLSTLLWAAVLKGCRAYEAYQRRHVGRVEPGRVVEFLLLEPAFPRSVRFCLESLAQALEAIEGEASRRHRGSAVAAAPAAMSQAERLLGMMRAELTYTPLEQIMAADLHEFLGRLLEQVGQVSWAVQEQYSLR
jgi:uncharacterized alpha-E superfamily protein